MIKHIKRLTNIILSMLTHEILIFRYCSLVFLGNNKKLAIQSTLLLHGNLSLHFYLCLWKTNYLSFVAWFEMHAYINTNNNSDTHSQS